MAAKSQNCKRVAVSVFGIVQGVGFRPFLHRTARDCGVAGWVRNTSLGVELEIEGEAAAADAFLHTLRSAPPPLAVIEEVRAAELPGLAGYQGFVIRESRAGEHDTLVSPDVGTCPDCLRELRNPADRRYRYPFINCTNCDPRFTITKTVPYDRKNTTMAPFAMCSDCAAEYTDIDDRRYHAQPDCCPACGPQLWFADAEGRRLPGEPFAQAQALLKAGGILAVKGLGGFHLACIPEDASVVEKLRRRKRRDEKPFALMCPDAASAERFCSVSEAEKGLLESFRRPIVLLRKREPGVLPPVSETREIGVMLPYTPVHYLLFDPVPGAAGAEDAGPFVFDALVMTSANLSDCPVLTKNEDAVRALHGIADGFLLHDREIDARCDDSLVRCEGGDAYFFRRSRGYAPQPVFCDFDADGILALGAEQKASFAFGKGHAVFYSQHIGDLKNAETLLHYEQQIERFTRLFGLTARQLVCDLHPDYLSTQYAEERAAREKLPVLAVQHHWAHLASCMADNRLSGRVIGLIWDGTGLGTDGAIWGGEALIGGYAGFYRAASLRPVSLIGGDTATKQIGRIGYALALDAGIPEASALPPAEKALLQRMLSAGLNCPASSGMGRLFDGVYALVTGRNAVTYEGQGAVLLEAMAAQAEAGRYPVEFDPDAGGLPRLDTRPVVRALWREKCGGAAPDVLAARFLNTLVETAAAQCRIAREAGGPDQVVLSGGVWLDQYLLQRVQPMLHGLGFTVYRHRRVSAGDEGIALGQAAIAAARKSS